MVVRVNGFACLWVPCFGAAALERCEPGLVERPLAIVRGTAPTARVVDANAVAREAGVVPGLTEAEARARCTVLVTRGWCDARAASAQQALLDAAGAISPRVEEAGHGLVYVDVAGLERLIGDAGAAGQRLLRQARAVGLDARVGLAGTRTAARVAARLGPRLTVITPGDERRALAGAPLAVLDLAEPVAATLRLWGVRTLGDLAALPRDGVAIRLGAPGLAAHDGAQGLDREPFRPYTPPPFWDEAQSLDWEVTDLTALVAILDVVLARLAARLAAAHVAADTLDVRLTLASGARHERALTLAYPTRDAKLLLTVARLDLEARPPAAAVTHVAVSARVVPSHAPQSRLGEPPLPAQRDLATLLIRLAALVGADNVGAPALDDSYRPDPVVLQAFLLSGTGPLYGAGSRADATPAPASLNSAGTRPDGTPALASASPLLPRLALRRLRPPREIQVETSGGRPVRVRWGERVSRVVASAGPWRRSGDWWDTAVWARDEWDVLLADGPLCRLALEARGMRWLMDGVYD